MSGFSLVMSTCPSGGEGGKREYIYNISCRCVGISLLRYTGFCMGIFFILVFWVSFCKLWFKQIRRVKAQVKKLQIKSDRPMMKQLDYRQLQKEGHFDLSASWELDYLYPLQVH